ncbi:MAG: spore coat protein [Bacillales bacterium]|jgi:spore coat protein F|nr:spore coat protein [Bacillales bacterium]
MESNGNLSPAQLMLQNQPQFQTQNIFLDLDQPATPVNQEQVQQPVQVTGMQPTPATTPNTLAWHETLELHELTTFNAIGLMKIKMGLKQITDPRLIAIYQETITGLETSIRELMQFYPYAPKPGLTNQYRQMDTFFAADLLAFTKSAVRNYSVAITETATPMLKDVLVRQLNTGIDAHTKIFNYIEENGNYPSYELNRMLQNDMNLAQQALSM